jgi:CBS domain-containing protein
MKIRDVCNREVVVVGHDESALDAAKLMREFHVGDVIIVRSDREERIPVGIVTDRDLVLEVLALEVNPETIEVGDLFATGPLVKVTEDDDLTETLQLMRDHGVRRVPVVDSSLELTGIVSVDDVLDLLAEQINLIADLSPMQLSKERDRR